MTKSMKKVLMATAATALALTVSAVAFAGSKSVPTNAGIERAATNASKAGINLLNTIISDASVGNGTEMAALSVDSVVGDPYDVTTTSYGDTTTTETTTTETVPGDTVTSSTGWVLRPGQGNNSQAYVYKRKVTVTETGEIITTTEVTSETPYETVGDTLQDTTTTTVTGDLDPGKSQPVNKPPEGDALTVDVEVTTADIGDIYETGTLIDTDTFQSSETYETVISTSNEVCNQGNLCPDWLEGY